MEYTTLDKISENLDSMRKPITSSDRVEGEIPYYGASGIVDSVKDYIFDEPLLLVSEDGANLLARSTPIAFSIDGKTWVNNHAHVLRFRDKNLQKYVEIYLNHISLESYITGSAQPKLNQKKLNEIPIPVADQNTIVQVVSTIEKVYSIIEQRKQELQKLDELIKARFVEMFGDPEMNPLGWDKRPLAEIITNANNGMARRGNDEAGNIVMRLVELQDGYIDYSNPNRIILKDNEKKRYLLKDKDFLFARVNGNPDNVGRCAVFRDIGEEVYHNDHIIRVHFNEEQLEGTFASALLNSDYGKRQLKSQIKTSAGQYTVSQDGIGAILTIIPPMELQEKFRNFVQQVDKSKLI